MNNKFKNGFATQSHEITVEELALEGAIPQWLVGSLIRNTPAQYEIGRRSYRHWFDGLAMLYSFTFENGRVSYRNRFIQSKAHRENNATGEIKFSEFATNRSQTLFSRLFNAFQKTGLGGNTNVNVARFGDRYVALTETPLAMVFDRHSLETIGVYDYEKTDAQLSTAHPQFDFARNMGITYAAKIGMSSEYRFYNLNGKKLNLLATIPTKKLAYIHSFGMTEHYLLLAEYAFKLSNVLGMDFSGKPFIENFEWLPESGSRFIVVDKASGKVISEAETEAFFAFHHINAFERDGEIVADFAAYPDAKIVQQFYLDALRADGAGIACSEFRRFRIPLNSGRATYELVTDENIEFPRINYEQYNGKPYGCVFGTSIQKGTAGFYNQLTKFDVTTGAVKIWHEADCYPGEPVFVSAPESSTEDAGVVLSVVFNSQLGTSFLLVLDGQSFAEIARTSLPQNVPFGFHGQFFKEK
jgi:beta,beta-carotene 9',10'-dioxygenase